MADINKPRAEVAQMILSVGEASNLTTQDKSSLVAATNELNAKTETMKSHMQVVESLPAEPDPETFYFIYEATSNRS